MHQEHPDPAAGPRTSRGQPSDLRWGEGGWSKREVFIVEVRVRLQAFKVILFQASFTRGRFPLSLNKSICHDSVTQGHFLLSDYILLHGIW